MYILVGVSVCVCLCVYLYMNVYIFENPEFAKCVEFEI